MIHYVVRIGNDFKAKANNLGDAYKEACKVFNETQIRPSIFMVDNYAETEVLTDVHYPIEKPVDLFTTTKKKAQDSTTQEQGKKYDSNKPMAGTVIRVFPQAIMAIGAVIREGAKKYPNPNNWKLNDNIEARYFDSLIRHMCKHFSGQVKDEDTGLLHLIHAAWNAIAILEKYLIDNPDEAKAIMYPKEIRE